MRRLIGGLSAVVLVAAGYVAADAYDVVPGVLTLDQPQPITVPEEQATEPAPEAMPDLVADEPVLAPLADDAPVPTTSGLADALRDDLGDDWLGSRVGAVVRDGDTGEVLYERHADRTQQVASTQKLLSAAAVSSTTDLASSMTTRVVEGESEDEIVLVAGGDTMLARGEGDPTKVEGRAGLTDLADQVAESLGERQDGLTLRLDATYAAGERYPDSWDMADVSSGFTQGVTMIGLAGQRPLPYDPSPRFPEREVLSAFADRLEEAGVSVTVEDGGDTWRTAAPDDAEELGSVESAPMGEVLALALQDSDNALTENLARQAAVADGAGAGFTDVAGWITTTLEQAGADMTGVRLLDASGLSRGQRATARSISDAMELGVTGDGGGLRGVLADLPVAALSGTLDERFTEPESQGAAGVARAKTGTLTGVSSLAGTTTTADGRLLTYVIVADQVPDSTGTIGARSVLDRAVATLTGCGCR
ncbi:hypothetical protein GCM10027055_09820 [Janibacter alkaliphilus]|uniref:D-alanyl-D-alanine carboxypeptidase/D-alanyl-D-alanine-endopeptidase (Penicillin-binding protein 4) n=1 Tax=Janibacter alkaliphilus TaxID=1069963 RepID=A0A852XBS0_9MICO|nr:D-alanyl-D-alanine carboxypeptidase/D-alanyl-D-alanine-endopeptidase (penicillin-binding protein 4) [Janibacter alkaliphilus]